MQMKPINGLLAQTSYKCLDLKSTMRSFCNACRSHGILGWAWHNRNATADFIHALLPVISGRAWYNETHMHYTCAHYTSTLMKTCHSHVSHAEVCGMSQHRCTSTEHAFSELHAKQKSVCNTPLHSFRTWIYHTLMLRCPQEAWLVLLAVTHLCMQLSHAVSPCLSAALVICFLPVTTCYRHLH